MSGNSRDDCLQFIAGKLWHYRTFSDAFSKRHDFPVVSYELQAVVKELETLLY